VDKDTVNFFVTVMERIIHIEQLQIASMKSFMGRFETIEQMEKMRADLDKMDNAEATKSLREQLAELENKNIQTNAAFNKQLCDVIARAESEHEKLEALLVTLKSIK